MYEQAEKPKESKNRAVSNSVAQKKSNVKQGFGFVDNRTSVREITQRVEIKGGGKGGTVWDTDWTDEQKGANVPKSQLFKKQLKTLLEQAEKESSSESDKSKLSTDIAKYFDSTQTPASAPANQKDIDLKKIQAFLGNADYNNSRWVFDDGKNTVRAFLPLDLGHRHVWVAIDVHHDGTPGSAWVLGTKDSFNGLTTPHGSADSVLKNPSKKLADWKEMRNLNPKNQLPWDAEVF